MLASICAKYPPPPSARYCQPAAHGRERLEPRASSTALSGRARSSSMVRSIVHTRSSSFDHETWMVIRDINLKTFKKTAGSHERH